MLSSKFAASLVMMVRTPELDAKYHDCVQKKANSGGKYHKPYQLEEIEREEA